MNFSRVKQYLCCLILVCGLSFLSSHPSQATPLLMNGDFNQVEGWSSVSSDTNVADWFISTVGDSTPVTGFDTSSQGNASGNYAVTDAAAGAGFQVIPHATALFQSFVVPEQVDSVMLSLDMFVNDWSGQTEFNANQTARVDIMSANSAPFDTAAGVVVNAYLGTDGGPPPNPFTFREYELLPFVEPGQQYLFRVLVNATENWLHVGVDNVEIEAIVPEPNFGLANLAVCCAAALILFSRVPKTLTS